MSALGVPKFYALFNYDYSMLSARHFTNDHKL